MNLTQAKTQFDLVSITQICDSLPSVRILDGSLKSYGSSPKLFGPAFTVMSEGDLLPVILALQQAQEGQIIVVDSDNSPFALAGDILSSEAKRRKIGGIIINGFCRDTESIKQVGIPFYARGICPKAGSKTKLGKLNIPLSFCGVSIQPNDIILGDDNGLIVLAPEELENALNNAQAISQREERAIKKIHNGQSLAEITNLEEHYQKILAGKDSTFQWK